MTDRRRTRRESDSADRRAGPPPRRGLPLIVAVAILVVIIGLGAQGISHLGFRQGFWPLATSLQVFQIGAWVSLGGAILAVLAAIATRPGTRRRGFVPSILALLIGLAAWGSATYWQVTALRAPPIHDVTTDPTDPPAFVALRTARINSPNGTDYGGADVAALQHAAYPTIVPAIVTIAPAAAFDRALATARTMHWAIASVDSTDGRIEATATTPWFGFVDDIIIRVTPDPTGSRIDVRSASRTTDTDGGRNAARVRTYLTRLTRAPISS
jgi:uncharacterized protein (DUF1499 family)